VFEERRTICSSAHVVNWRLKATIKVAAALFPYLATPAAAMGTHYAKHLFFTCTVGAQEIFAWRLTETALCARPTTTPPQIKELAGQRAEYSSTKFKTTFLYGRSHFSIFPLCWRVNSPSPAEFKKASERFCCKCEN
jgi:hypothetical protein